MTKEKHEILKIYNEAMALYKQRNWKEAMATFNRCLAIDPKDGPSKLYVERCEAHIASPPDEDWDGVFVMKTK